MFNLTVLSGNLTRDPDIKVFDAGGKKVTVANFTIASSRPFTKKDGTPGKDVLFLDCEAWDTGAQTIGKYCTKGSRLTVQGELRNESWEDKDTGAPRSKIKLRVSKFDLPPKKTEGAAEHPVSAPEGEPTDDVEAPADSEIPF